MLTSYHLYLNLFISLNTGFTSTALPGTPLLLEPYVLYFFFLSLLLFIRNISMRGNVSNHTTELIISSFETSFVKAMYPNLYLSFRYTLLQGQKAAKFFTNTSKKQFLGHILKLFSFASAWARAAMFKTPSAPISSRSY